AVLAPLHRRRRLLKPRRRKQHRLRRLRLLPLRLRPQYLRPFRLVAIAPSPRRSLVVWPRKPGSTCPRLRALVHTAASSRATSRLPLQVVAPRRLRLLLGHGLQHRLRPPRRSLLLTMPFSSYSSRAPTNSCRMTACARSLPSVSSSPN